MAVADSLESLDNIFNKRLFRIPDYQRGYSWEKNQLEDFWDDLERLEEDKDHYTGLLTLGYEDATDPSYDYLRFEIFKRAGKPSHNQNAKTYYTKNLEKAVEFFEGKIAEIESTGGVEDIEDIYDKLTSHMKFNLYEIDNELDEYVSFETMNNRGKKLSNLELLKNRLIYLTTLFDDTCADDERNSLRKKINRAWKEIYFWLGKNEDPHHLSDDDFLRQHWIIYFKIPAKKADEMMDFLMNKTFSARKLKKNKYEDPKDKTTYEDIRDYVTSLHDFVKIYYYTFYPLDSSLSAADKRLLDSLTPLTGIKSSATSAASKNVFCKILWAICCCSLKKLIPPCKIPLTPKKKLAIKIIRTRRLRLQKILNGRRKKFLPAPKNSLTS